MALTGFQRRVCRLLADARRGRGDSYVAGGAALNEVLATPRQSDDVDLWNDALHYHTGRIQGAYPQILPG